MTNDDYELVEVRLPEDWADYHSIRRAVLFEARGNFNYDPNDADEYLSQNQPLLLKFRGRAIGTTRLDRLDSTTGAIRLVAIRPELQGQGHGRVLSQMVENRARAQNLTILFVNAVREAIGYYQTLGYTRHAFDPNELTGIASECVQMQKQLIQRLP